VRNRSNISSTKTRTPQPSTHSTPGRTSTRTGSIIEIPAIPPSLCSVAAAVVRLPTAKSVPDLSGQQARRPTPTSTVAVSSRSFEGEQWGGTTTSKRGGTAAKPHQPPPAFGGGFASQTGKDTSEVAHTRPSVTRPMTRAPHPPSGAPNPRCTALETLDLGLAQTRTPDLLMVW